MDESPAIGIRERARGALRGELADVALRLFEERGYDQTPVDDIASAAGISPRTFYRYFGTKEEVLFGDLPPTSVDLPALLEDHLRGRGPGKRCIRRCATSPRTSAPSAAAGRGCCEWSTPATRCAPGIWNSR